MSDGRTHYADDETIAYIAKLEAENNQLRAERDRLKGLLLGIRDGAKWDANSDHGLVARIDDELAALTQREGGDNERE